MSNMPTIPSHTMRLVQNRPARPMNTVPYLHNPTACRRDGISVSETDDTEKELCAKW